MLSFRTKAAFGALIVSLSACMQVPESPTAGPGTIDADPATAAQIFNAMCLSQQPNFAGTAAAAAAFSFTRNSTFGTYYHNEQNLSVKLLGNPPDTCSVVFATSADPIQSLVGFGESLNAIAPGDNSTVNLRRNDGPDGKHYLNARISAQ